MPRSSQSKPCLAAGCQCCQSDLFVRNGAQQTSDDRDEVAFMEFGSTGTFSDNIFFAADTDQQFVLNERRNGTLDFGWTTSNNTIHDVADIATQIADTPAVQSIMFDPDT